MEQDPSYPLLFTLQGKWTTTLNTASAQFSPRNPNGNPKGLFVYAPGVSVFQLNTEFTSLVSISLGLTLNMSIGFDTAGTVFDANAVLDGGSKNDTITVFSAHDHETLTHSGRLHIALTPAADVGRALRGGFTDEMLAEIRAKVAEHAA